MAPMMPASTLSPRNADAPAAISRIKRQRIHEHVQEIGDRGIMCCGCRFIWPELREPCLGLLGSQAACRATAFIIVERHG